MISVCNVVAGQRAAGEEVQSHQPILSGILQQICEVHAPFRAHLSNKGTGDCKPPTKGQT